MLYGAGSGYNQGTLNFQVDSIPDGTIYLVLDGLDDESAGASTLQVFVNDVRVFNGPNGFPQVPHGDNGVGGRDRYWGQVSIAVPASALRRGVNTLTLRNTAPGGAVGAPPYILISGVTFAVE